MSVLSKDFREIGDLFIDCSKNITPLELEYGCRWELDLQQKTELLDIYHQIKETPFFEKVFNKKLSKLLYYSCFFNKSDSWEFFKDSVLKQSKQVDG